MGRFYWSNSRFYSSLMFVICSLFQFIVNFIIVFFVNWSFALAHFAAIIVIHFYIGWASPGVFPGKYG